MNGNPSTLEQIDPVRLTKKIQHYYLILETECEKQNVAVPDIRVDHPALMLMLLQRKIWEMKGSLS